MDGDDGLALGNRSRLSVAEGRRFARTLGLAFVAIAAVALWRGHQVPAIVAAALGVVLGVAGLFAPVALSPIQRGWMQGALALSRLTTPLLLAMVYLLGFVPTAIAMRLAGRRPLSHGAPKADSVWIRRAPTARQSDLSRQF